MDTKPFPWAPGSTGSKAPGVTGKFAEVVEPPTYALPVPSARMASPVSPFVPPRKVEYSREAFPVFPVSTRLTKATPLAFPVV